MARRGKSLLERERRRRDMTATDLAERMGVSRSAISQVERGWLRPSPSFKERAAEALGMDQRQLFPELWFLAEETKDATRFVKSDGVTVAFSTEDAGDAAARALAAQDGTKVVALGPAPLTFFALARGLEEQDVLGQMLVDPKLDQNDEGPAANRALNTRSAGDGDGHGPAE